jgi:hypothetical protein
MQKAMKSAQEMVQLWALLLVLEWVRMSWLARQMV